MTRAYGTLALAAISCCAMSASAGDGWLNLADQTAARYSGPANLFTTDQEEKDYGWGDLDNDGDIDLVIVRKQPFTSTGKRVNVLLMNENGVLTDRTEEFATAVLDVPGDEGFDTPTNDRDVAVADVDNDGWLDVITATTLTDNQAKHLSHPRVYMNLGNDGSGNWQGLQFENFRIPQMHATAGPRFCSVSAGDVTGDGYADLYFGDYDSGGTMIFDYNNKLLINDGTGVFADESNLRLTAQMRLAAFGAASIIVDMNNDGVNDAVKQTSLASPTHVAITYNNPANEGFFNGYDTIDSNAPYFVTEGDLNNDGRLDLVVVDDGTDKYYLNTGNGGDGQANFSVQTLAGTGGFGGNAIIRDLNNDGFADVIITDVDVDIPGCSRETVILRNMGNVPNVSLQEQDQVIPTNMLDGWHDAAIFDIDGDGWLDCVAGRCSGTQIWMNQPPVTGLLFNYLNGLPGYVTPGEAYAITLKVAAAGVTQPMPDSAELHYSVNGGPFTTVGMTSIGTNVYTVSLPAMACTESIDFYFSADSMAEQTWLDPASAPDSVYTAIAAEGLNIDRNEFEDGPTGWTVTSDPSVTAGAWELSDPEGTLFNNELAAPDQDATQAGDAVMAWVTQNGAAGGEAGAADLDGGPTRLFSPVIDLDGTDATISYNRWFFSNGTAGHTPDFLTVDISNNGGKTWTSIPEHTTGGTSSAWELVSFVVSDYVVPSSTLQVRFTASDSPNDSVTEAGIDNFQVDSFICDTADPCPTDIDGNGATDVDDLVAIIVAWGTSDPDADIDGSGTVNVDDLVALIVAWGACDN